MIKIKDLRKLYQELNNLKNTKVPPHDLDNYFRYFSLFKKEIYNNVIKLQKGDIYVYLILDNDLTIIDYEVTI